MHADQKFGNFVEDLIYHIDVGAFCHTHISIDLYIIISRMLSAHETVLEQDSSDWRKNADKPGRNKSNNTM